jgi:hypothetical protein
VKLRRLLRRVAYSPALRIALPLAYFDSLGLPRLYDGLALPSEPPDADPHVGWCGRGERATAPPMPIWYAPLTCLAAACCHSTFSLRPAPYRLTKPFFGVWNSKAAKFPGFSCAGPETSVARLVPRISASFFTRGVGDSCVGSDSAPASGRCVLQISGRGGWIEGRSLGLGWGRGRSRRCLPR